MALSRLLINYWFRRPIKLKRPAEVSAGRVAIINATAFIIIIDFNVQFDHHYGKSSQILSGILIQIQTKPVSKLYPDSRG